jgi:hypothetical protein
VSETCECGCGELVTHGSWKRGHSSRVKNPAAAKRDHWPSRAHVQELLDELGTVTAVAERLGRSRSNMLAIVHEYGIEHRPRGGRMVDCPNRIGWAGEEHAALLLDAEIVRGADPRAQPFDLLWRGQRVDVKTARPSANTGSKIRGWTFNVTKGRGRCDVFFLIACGDEGIPIRYFLIPEQQVDVGMIRIQETLSGRWARYQVQPTITHR